MTASGIALVPTAPFADAPVPLDVLFVPGGFGTVEAMQDGDIIAFLAERGRGARMVTSVCSGSLLLGMAGLLDGYRAATHWTCYDALEALGAQPGHERVVADRNRFTGGGVTAGIDFGLTLLAELRGEQVAKLTQLLMEYDPAPPFNTGHPRLAGPELTAAALKMVGKDMLAKGVEVARTRRERAGMTKGAGPEHIRLERLQLRRLELASLVEATTLILLVGVAVPLKHLAGHPVAVAVMGPVHGFAFVAYIWTVLQTVAEGGWRRPEWLRLVATAFVPFAGYANLALIRRKAGALALAPARAR